MLLVLAGLPEPEVNREVLDGHGNVIMRLDLAYPGVRVAVEYDGRQHAEDERQWNRDLGRREDLDDADWRILVVTRRGVLIEPSRTIERVFRLLRTRGMPGLPLRPSDDWRLHFSARR
jgi:very-short-patch-repair endonuclease